MISPTAQALSDEIRGLREALQRMESRGDRVPLELDEKLHAIEELIADLIAALNRKKH